MKALVLIRKSFNHLSVFSTPQPNSTKIGNDFFGQNFYSQTNKHWLPMMDRKSGQTLKAISDVCKQYLDKLLGMASFHSVKVSLKFMICDLPSQVHWVNLYIV